MCLGQDGGGSKVRIGVLSKELTGPSTMWRCLARTISEAYQTPQLPEVSKSWTTSRRNYTKHYPLLAHRISKVNHSRTDR